MYSLLFMDQIMNWSTTHSHLPHKGLTLSRSDFFISYSDSPIPSNIVINMKLKIYTYLKDDFGLSSL